MNQITRTLSMLAFALVFMAGAAFAQSNEAKINNPSGDDNEATIEQVGEINKASIYLGQSNKNEVEIDQHGTDNNTRFEFRGDRNEIDGIQNGSGNFMYVNFRGTGPGPGGSSGASRSDFDFEQYGHQNRISGGIVGDRNSGDVLQDGTGNLLVGGGDNWDAAGLMVDGNRNHIDVDQIGDENEGLIEIIGNRNDVTLDQHGFGHYGEITINGSGNTHRVEQSNF
jgi:hypothetical protein